MAGEDEGGEEEGGNGGGLYALGRPEPRPPQLIEPPLPFHGGIQIHKFALSPRATQPESVLMHDVWSLMSIPECRL